MQKQTLIAVAAAVGLLTGCSQQSDNGGTPRGGTSEEQTVPTTGRGLSDTNAGSRDANNTGINVRDRSGDTLTPGDQGGSEGDREITRQVRRALTSSELSTDAKNVKIMTMGGKVTLRGPVSSAQEKQAVADAAKKVAGVTSVDDQLEIKPMDKTEKE